MRASRQLYLLMCHCVCWKVQYLLVGSYSNAFLQYMVGGRRIHVIARLVRIYLR
jgi:hypothetical protein